MSEYTILTEEIYKLTQSNQAKLGRFFEIRDGLNLSLTSQETKNINTLAQQYTDLMYLARDLESNNSYIQGLNQVSVIKKRLSEIDKTLSTLSNSSIVEINNLVGSIRQQDLYNKINELIQLSSSYLNDDKKNIDPSYSIQNSSSFDQSQISKQKELANSNAISKVKPPDWGIKFTIGPNKLEAPYNYGPYEIEGQSFYMTLLPAIASQLNLQGARDTPNAMPGLNFKIIPNIAKLKVPGFQPIYQNLGIDAVLCTIVGCFTGADGISEMRNGVNFALSKSQNKGDVLPYKGNGTFFKNGSDENSLKLVISELDSYRNFQEFYQMTILNGKEVSVEINLAKTSGASIQLGKDKNLRSGNGNPKFQAVIKSMEVYHAKSDRTWYTLQLEISDFGLASKTPINLTNKLNERIKAAQLEQQKLNKTSSTAVDEVKKKEAEEYLKKVQANQYKLKDGNLLYQTQDCSERKSSLEKANFPCKEKWLLQDSNGLRIITNADELEKLKSNRTEISPTTGDWLSLLGSGFGCGAGVGTIIASGGSASILVGVGTAAACGGLAVDIYNLLQGNTGKTTTEGVIDLGLNVVPATGLGKAGLNALKTIPGVTKAGAAIGNITSKIPGSVSIGKATSILDTPLSQAFPKTGAFLENNAERLNPKNYSIFNRSSGLPSSAPEVLQKAEDASTFLGPLGTTNSKNFKGIIDFLIQNKAGGVASTVILKDGRIIKNAKLGGFFDDSLTVVNDIGKEFINPKSIQSIQLGTGEIWRLP